METLPVLPLAEQLDDTVKTVAKELLKVNGYDGRTENTDRRVNWPAQLGGMNFGSAALSARLGRLSALAQCLPTTQQHPRVALPHANKSNNLNAIVLDEGNALIEWLRGNHGIATSFCSETARDRQAPLHYRGQLSAN